MLKASGGLETNDHFYEKHACPAHLAAYDEAAAAAATLFEKFVTILFFCLKWLKQFTFKVEIENRKIFKEIRLRTFTAWKLKSSNTTHNNWSDWTISLASLSS